MIQTRKAVLNAEPVQRSRSELDALLQETRWRIQQASLEEKRLETELRVTELELRLGQAWVHRAEGRSEPALKLLRDLRTEAQSLPHRYDYLIVEIDTLERKLALPHARQEVERHLIDAARHCDRGNPPLAVQSLDEARKRLLKIPREGALDLYEKYLLLCDRCQAARRPALERFNELRASFSLKIAGRVGDLRRLSRLGDSLQQSDLEDLLNQVSVAQGILASLDPAVIGRQEHEGAAREFGDLRGVLIELLQKGAERTHAAAPAPPERAPVTPPPQPPSVPPLQETAGLRLSPWALGSWGTLSG